MLLIGYLAFLTGYLATSCYYLSKDRVDLHSDIIDKLYRPLVKRVILNLFVVIPGFLFSLNMMGLEFTGIAHFNLWQFVHIGICLIMTDIMFYTGHRVLHTKLLYPIHKVHHQLIQPVGFGAFHAHPVEVILCNILPAIIPLYILPMHWIIVCLYICIGAVNSVSSHSDRGVSDKFHDLHHTTNKYNYGAIGFMDLVCNTYYIK
jgi:sterol desaturase/sphingolipid hydroxylase (fatty acid hydroxylase superfamily)